MAKLKHNNYESIEINKEKTLVLCVDMINGFCKFGAMSDKDILSIVPNQISLLKGFNYDTAAPNLYFISDFHKEDAKEFDSFPKHCVKGTGEELVINELLSLFDDVPYIIKKNSTNAFYAIKEQTNVLNVLRYNDFDNIIVFGCCTDICVMQLVLSLQTYINEHNLKQQIIVPVDCVETYDSGNDYHNAEKFNQMALILMEQAGVKVVSNIN